MLQLQLRTAKRWQHVAFPISSPRLPHSIRHASTQSSNVDGDVPKRMAKRWTPEEDRELVELRASGVRLSDLHNYFPGIGLSAARSRLKAMRSGRAKVDSTLVAKLRKVSRSQKTRLAVTDEELDSVRALRQQHLTIEAVAQKLGMSWNRARYISHKTSNFRHPFRAVYTTAEDSQLIGLRAAGYRWETIQRQMPHRSAKSLETRWDLLNTGSAPVPSASQTRAEQLSKRRRFSKAETAELIRLHNLGKKTVHIASALSRDARHVTQKLWRLKKAARGQVGPESPADVSASQSSDGRLASLPVGNGIVHSSQARPQLRSGRIVPSRRRAYSTAHEVTNNGKQSHRKPWTPEEELALTPLTSRRFGRDSPLLAEIARSLGRTTGAVTVHVHRMSRIRSSANTRKPWTTEQDNSLKQLYISGLSIPEIAAQLGRGAHAVLLRTSKLGLANRRTPPCDFAAIDMAAIVRQHKAGLTWQEIATEARLNCSALRVYAVRHNLVQRRKSQSVGLNAQSCAELRELLRQRCDIEKMAKLLHVAPRRIPYFVRYSSYGHRSLAQVRTHATALYLREQHSYQWRQIGLELNSDPGGLVRIYIYSSCDIYAGLVEDDPRSWSDEKLKEVAEVVWQRVAARNAELGIPWKKQPS